MIKCACGDPQCIGNINIDGPAFWVTNKDDKEVMIYLDDNAKVDLIRELQASLVKGV